jgi:hypothetical protein
MIRKQSKRVRLISELACIRRVQAERPSWFRQHDYDRLARDFASKSAELIALEIAAYDRKFGLK